MSKEKQIEEIKQVLMRTYKRARTPQEDYMQDRYAEALYNAGYRKQKEGDWNINGTDGNIIGNWRCSACNGVSLKNSNYCPNCGACLVQRHERSAEDRAWWGE